MAFSACNTSHDSSDDNFNDTVASVLAGRGNIALDQMQWTREPMAYSISGDSLSITTAAPTALWQRTYYHFRNDNAPVFQMQTDEQYFSFVVKTDFSQSHRPMRCRNVS